MKKLYIPYIESLNNTPIENADEVLENDGFKSAVEYVNWAEKFPYKPITIFYIARSQDSIFIRYSVKGTMLKAVYTNDQDPVWQDSCVEFFCMPVGGEKYVNFEFNCIGTCLATRRKGREEDIVPLSDEEMKSIERFSSLGRKPFKEMEGMFEWELTVKIPLRILGLDKDNLPEKIKGNFYKCADDTDSVHYVSWSPIKTENPDFHRPDFFGELYFFE